MKGKDKCTFNIFQVYAQGDNHESPNETLNFGHAVLNCMAVSHSWWDFLDY